MKFPLLNRRGRRALARQRSRSSGRRTAPALCALRRAALALTTLASQASADTPVDRITADYNYSLYSEAELNKSDGLAGAERDRYEVTMHQFRLQSPIPFSERMDFSVELVQEAMSGASPWYVVPDAAGSPIQVMSGATIKEERNDLLISTNRYYYNARVGLTSGYSSENDYSSFNFSFDGVTHFNEKNTSLSAGLGISFDTIEPTDAELFTTRPAEEEKKSYTLFLGLSQLLGRASTIQSSLTFNHGNGYLSDPYKSMFVLGGTFLPDSRPDSRNQIAWLTRFRRHLREIDGTLHADYRLYADDWGVTSHTIELAYHKELWRSLKIVPSVRYYSQTAADFYEPFFNALPTGDEFTNDYRLSAYGALSFGLKAEWFFRIPWTGRSNWRAILGWEHYVSSGDLALVEVTTPAPGLVDYNVVTIGRSVAY